MMKKIKLKKDYNLYSFTIEDLINKFDYTHREIAEVFNISTAAIKHWDDEGVRFGRGDHCDGGVGIYKAMIVKILERVDIKMRNTDNLRDDVMKLVRVARADGVVNPYSLVADALTQVQVDRVLHYTRDDIDEAMLDNVEFKVKYRDYDGYVKFVEYYLEKPIEVNSFEDLHQLFEHHRFIADYLISEEPAAIDRLNLGGSDNPTVEDDYHEIINHTRRKLDRMLRSFTLSEYMNRYDITLGDVVRNLNTPLDTVELWVRLNKVFSDNRLSDTHYQYQKLKRLARY